MPLLHEPIDEQVKQRAFEIWYLEAGRSPKATSRILKETYGDDVRPNTISEWARTKQWHLTANNLLASIAPGMRTEMLSNILVAGVKASRIISEMLTDASDGVRLDGAASKLAIETLHLAGFSPIGTRNPLDSQRSAMVDRSKLMELYHSDDEIAALMEAGQRAIAATTDPKENEVRRDYDQFIASTVEVDYRTDNRPQTSPEQAETPAG